MKKLYRHVCWILKGIQVFALVGRSGTGKSFRAKLIAQKYGVDLMIDDGLLIQDQKIIAGKSAKKELAFLGAIKTALFDDSRHRQEVCQALTKTKFKRVLIIGTSEKMAKKIAHRLDLPPINKVIKIEDVASKEDIETAQHFRKQEGKHIIPVPAVEISQKYSHIFYDSIRVFLRRRFMRKGKSAVFEKTVVQPNFGSKGRITISEAALSEMVVHCVEEYNESILVKKVSVRNGARGYRLTIDTKIPFGFQMSGVLHDLQSYIVDNLERYTGIMIDRMDIRIDNVSAQNVKTSLTGETLLR